MRNKYQDYKYIQSKNGKYLLLFDGFAYRKYMTSKSNQSYWTCTLRGCKAKGTMTPDGWFSLTKYTHNHDPSQAEMQKKEVTSQLRKLALSTELTAVELMRQVGILEDPDKKFRDAINFWRWRAKRKSEAEVAGGTDSVKRMELADNDYKFVKTDHSYFLHYKNFLYRKYMTSKVDTGSYWRCRRDECPARAKLDSASLLTCTNMNHNHPEEEVEGENMDQDIRQQVREAALTTNYPVAEILRMYGAEQDAELKKYVKNIRCRKMRLMREKKRQVDEKVMDQIGMLENVPPGVFVKIPKDLLCEISEVSGGETDLAFPEGTILTVDDRALVQVVNVKSEDGEADTLDGTMFFHDTEEEEAEGGEEDGVGQVDLTGHCDETEVQYEAVNLADYTTYVIAAAEKDDKVEYVDLDSDKDGLIAKMLDK